MTPVQRAALAAAMSTAIEIAARAGIRVSELDADDARVRFLGAQRRYGTEEVLLDAALKDDVPST